MSDVRPFPIQSEIPKERDERGGLIPIMPCTIPWWLAEIAYEYYSERYGTGQSLERLAERGGFGRYELVALIRRDETAI